MCGVIIYVRSPYALGYIYWCYDAAILTDNLSNIEYTVKYAHLWELTVPLYASSINYIHGVTIYMTKSTGRLWQNKTLQFLVKCLNFSSPYSVTLGRASTLSGVGGCGLETWNRSNVYGCFKVYPPRFLLLHILFVPKRVTNHNTIQFIFSSHTDMFDILNRPNVLERYCLNSPVGFKLLTAAFEITSFARLSSAVIGKLLSQINMKIQLKYFRMPRYRSNNTTLV